jgi:hypothetical protein
MSKSDSDTDEETAQFHIDEDEKFYITIADGATVYEDMDSAVAEVGEKVNKNPNAFIAETEINGSGDDMSIGLEQVPWQNIVGMMGDDGD